MRRDTCETDTTIAAEKLSHAKTDIRRRPKSGSEREEGPHRRYWLAVASADHARRGKTLGIMQVCHGKGAPLRRIQPGDGIVYYSPTASLAGKDRLQAFTAIGIVQNDRTYQVDMGDGFRPFRREVKYCEANEASILPLLDQLELTRGKRNWGYPFRFGLVEITRSDFDIISAAMALGRAD
jgi:EVE domain